MEVPDFLAGEIAVSWGLLALLPHPGERWHARRRLGEHNEEVLSGILDYSAEEISRAFRQQPGHLSEEHSYDDIPGSGQHGVPTASRCFGNVGVHGP